MSCNSSSSSEAKCEKSKRKCAGSTSEPACFTCVPSTSRSAACSRCVPVWLRMVARRTSSLTIGVHFVADVNGLLGDDAMRAHALHGIGHAFDLGDQVL